MIVEAIVEDEVSEGAMAPIAMDCESEGCQYATKEYEPAVAVELLKFHREDKHPGRTVAKKSRD